jgi:glycosyltransferase involved in cell wall biosynthesis
MKGISIIICCYNSTQRLEKTIGSIANQQNPLDIALEVVVVDNNSSDGTFTFAEKMLSATGLAYKVVPESNPGLSLARKCGVYNSKFEYIIFCDDDNWLNEDYITVAYNIMESDKNLAACGGQGIPAFDRIKPSWFDTYSACFALGDQSESVQHHELYGAGLVVRREILLNIYNLGFHSLLSDRKGSHLSSGGDTELTVLFKLLGYNLAYSKGLKFVHFMSEERLQWNYLKALFIGFGSGGPYIHIYREVGKGETSDTFIWIKLFLKALVKAIYFSVLPPKTNSRSIYWLWSKAYIGALWKIKSDESISVKKICTFIDQYKKMHRTQ